MYDSWNFLGLEEEFSSFEKAKVLVLPIPMEATVTYGHGTAHGPKALIEASRQVELYDREFGVEAALSYGVHTLPAVALSRDPAEAIEQITAAVTLAARTGKFLVGLGGEHSLSYGFGKGLLQALGSPITVLQVDAHSDLRDEYEGSPFNHACVARRLLDTPGIEQILQLGIRSTCPEEVDLVRQTPDKLRVWYNDDVHAGGWEAEFIERIRGRRVYLTFDVDGLDPSIIPATGTPEPDGLTWQQALTILRLANQYAQVIGMDMVELAPAPGLHMAEFAAAKLLYKAINYAVYRP